MRNGELACLKRRLPLPTESQWSVGADPPEEQGIVGGRLGDMKEAAQAPLGRISAVAPLSLLRVGFKANT